MSLEVFCDVRCSSDSTYVSISSVEIPGSTIGGLGSSMGFVAENGRFKMANLCNLLVLAMHGVAREEVISSLNTFVWS